MLKRDIRITFYNSILYVFPPRQNTIRLNLLKWQGKCTEILYLFCNRSTSKGKRFESKLLEWPITWENQYEGDAGNQVAHLNNERIKSCQCDTKHGCDGLGLVGLKGTAWALQCAGADRDQGQQRAQWKKRGFASRTKRSNVMFRLLAILRQKNSEEQKELAVEILRPEDTCYFKAWHFVPLEISLFSVWVHQPFVFSSIFLIKIPNR